MTIPDSMIERVARAIHATSEPWDDFEIDRSDWLKIARAAIAALRGIPEHLLRASAGEDYHIDPEDGIYIDQWEAVIDAILQEAE